MTNQVKTSVLLAGLTALLVVLGYVLGGGNGAVLFFLISLLMNGISYWFSDSIALGMARARPLTSDEAPELFADTAELAQKMKIPTPRLYISEELQANAFATGRNPRSAAVCVTTGLLQNLDRNEVRGVIGHELSHILNRDTLITTIAAVMSGAISSLSQLAIYAGRSGDDEDSVNPVAAILLIITAPIAATLLQLAISRAREFAADAASAKFTGEPRALASALEKISGLAQQAPMDVNPSLASLYIANPFRSQSLLALFSTHPPVEARIAALLAMQQ